ncbi:MAG: RluA family pseudouridine synthase [Lachnospiraceae bacterium]|nr:RluA family pseudouridine synthase [Lachnospiraceae bacterium]
MVNINRTTKPIILFEDDHIIVCIKPAGIASQSAKSFQPDMTDILKKHLMTSAIAAVRNPKSSNDTRKIPEIYVVHRLDQPVGGIMVYAKTQKAAAALSKQTAEHTMSKSYFAVVHGEPASNGTLVDYLLKDGKTNTSGVVSKTTAGAKEASLEYSLINSKVVDNDTLSLIKVTLHTGRHHQIRVQFAHAGHPLLGDQKYSEYTKTTKGISTLGLFSCSLEFAHPITQERMNFEYTPDYAPFDLF